MGWGSRGGNGLKGRRQRGESGGRSEGGEGRFERQPEIGRSWAGRLSNAEPRQSAQLVNLRTPFSPETCYKRATETSVNTPAASNRPPHANSCRDPEIPISGSPEQCLRKPQISASARNRVICGRGDSQPLAPPVGAVGQFADPVFAGKPPRNTRRRRQSTRRRHLIDPFI